MQIGDPKPQKVEKEKCFKCGRNKYVNTQCDKCQAPGNSAGGTMKKYKCRNCKGEYKANPKTKGLRVWCSNQCGYELAIKARKKLEKIERKVVRAANKAEKLKIEPISYFEKKLQAVINEIARLIDYEQPCISCGSVKGKPQGGHYHSRGSNKTIAYNLHNIFSQCYRCNERKGANIIGYDEGLIATFDKGYWEFVKFELVRKYPVLKSTREELIEWATKARAIRNKMKKNPHQNSTDKRIELREWVNNELGIYK